MRNWYLMIACASLVLACKPDEPDAAAEPAPEPAPATTPKPAPAKKPESSATTGPPVGALVLLRGDATAYTSTGPDALPLSIHRYDAVPASYLVEVRSVRGEHIEVRTVASKYTDACAETFDAGDDFQLSFFVEPGALQPMLVRPKTATFEDGTKLAFRPGVPVLRDDSSARLLVGPARFEVALDDGDVGPWLTDPAQLVRPTPPAETETETETETTPAGDVTLHYGSSDDMIRVAPPLVMASRREAVEHGELLTFETACGTFTLLAKPEGEIVPIDKPGLYAMKGPKDGIPQMARNYDPEMQARTDALLETMADDPNAQLDREQLQARLGCELPHWTVEAGTLLTWDSGGEAGVVLRDHELPLTARERGSSVCFPAAHLSVCVDARKAKLEGDPHCHVAPTVWGGLVGSPVDDDGDDDDDGEVEGGHLPPIPSHNSRLPQVRQAKAKVGEGVDSDIVRRIVRAHINEVRSCYNQGLLDTPELAGRVVIGFEIGASGKVADSSVVSNGLSPANEAVANCIAKAVTRWTFTKPRGVASVSVSYPFVLEPG